MPEISIPDNRLVEKAIILAFEFMFHVNKSSEHKKMKTKKGDLRKHYVNLLANFTENNEAVTDEFLDNLYCIKDILNKDARFILESDPAAKQLIEVIAIYPGFFAIFCYRIANYLAKLSVPLLPRMMTEFAHRQTGIDIHPLASIGCPFSIDHGTGIVIGETTVIGNKVKMYQGVTLGALSVNKSKASKKRHPTIEDEVILYAGCTILGGSTVIGKKSIIGGNVWLTESVPAGSIVYHRIETVIKKQENG
jgi:serine O-acetyltransferase